MKFNEIADLVAKGINFENNACIVSVGIYNGEDLYVKDIFDGSDDNIGILISSIISGYIKKFEDRNIAIQKAYELEDVILNCIREIQKWTTWKGRKINEKANQRTGYQRTP